LPSFLLHEGRFVAIKLGEPLADFGNSRLKQNTIAHLPNSNLVSFETEFTWKTHGLTPAIAKQFGGLGGLRFRNIPVQDHLSRIAGTPMETKYNVRKTNYQVSI